MYLTFALALVAGAFVARRACARASLRHQCNDGCHDTPWRHHHARRRRWGMRHARRAAIGRLASELDATAAQERIITAELEAVEQRLRDAGGTTRDLRAQLADALRGATLEEGALDAVASRADATAIELRRALLDALRAIHAVLDDTQRARLAELVAPRSGPPPWYGVGPYR